MTSPWRTTKEAAEYWRFLKADGSPDLVRVHQHLARHVPRHLTKKLGRSVRIHVDALEGSMEAR